MCAKWIIALAVTGQRLWRGGRGRVGRFWLLWIANVVVLAAGKTSLPIFFETTAEVSASRALVGVCVSNLPKEVWGHFVANQDVLSHHTLGRVGNAFFNSGIKRSWLHRLCGLSSDHGPADLLGIWKNYIPLS